MARNTNIKLRRSATAGAKPTTSNLDLGELALNTYDGKLYAKTTEGSASEVIQVGSATDSYHKIRKSLTLEFAVTVASKTSDHAFAAATAVRPKGATPTGAADSPWPALA